jgi:hypothetical protein
VKEVLFWLVMVARPHHCEPVVRQNIMAEGLERPSCSWKPGVGRQKQEENRAKIHPSKSGPQRPTSSNEAPLFMV